MSATADPTTTDAGPAATTADVTSDEPLFDKTELKQFESDDREAGQAIGKMLSLFFLYTVVVMSLAAYWTWRSISQ